MQPATTNGRRWLRVELIILTVAVLGALIVGPLAAGYSPRVEPIYTYDWLDVVFNIAGPIVVLTHRWRLKPAFWATVVVAALAQATGHGLTLAVPAPGYLAFLLAFRGPRRTALVSAGWATAILLATAFVPLLHGADPWVRPGDSFLWVWIGIAAGIARRNHVLMVDALKERAEKAEAAQEEVALRLVAEDRVRIARELHDVLAHHVSAINVQAGVARHLIRQDPDAADAALVHVRTAANSVMTELQSILGVLRQNETLVPSEPAPTPDDLAETIRAASALGLDLTVDGPTRVDDLAPLARHAAHRFVQEALTNAGRHAPGVPVRLSVRRGDELVIEVRNAQPAARPTERTTAGAGFGLIGMRERIGAAGGTLSVERDEEFAVTARLPIEEQES